MSWFLAAWESREDKPQMIHRHLDNICYWVRTYVNDVRCSKCEAQAPEDMITQWLLIHKPSRLFVKDGEEDMRPFRYDEVTRFFKVEESENL